MYTFRDLKSDKPLQLERLPAEALAVKIGNQYTFLEELIPGYQTLQVSGRELSNYSLAETSINGIDGSIIGQFSHPSRDIDIKFQLQCDDPNDFRQKFNRLMYFLNNPNLSFNFKDEPDYFYTGILTKVNSVEAGELNVISDFTLHCPSPWKVSSVKSLTVANSDTIKDHYLIYPVIPESIIFSSTAANFSFTNQTQDQTFGLTTAHSNVVLMPNDGSVTSGGTSILNDITMFSELEQLQIKNGDVIKITNGSSATIKYRRWLL